MECSTWNNSPFSTCSTCSTWLIPSPTCSLFFNHVGQVEEVGLECSTWNNGRGSSPSWRTHFEKSHDSALRRGGVPVLRRIRSKPSLLRQSESWFTAGLLSPALSSEVFPIQIRPFKAVPDVTTAALQKIFPFDAVLMPQTVEQSFFVLDLSPCGSTRISITESSRTVRLGWLRTTDCILSVYFSFAHWQRVAQTAGPRLRFKVFD